METILKWMLAHWIQCAGILAVFVQIAPIKVSPITALVNWVGNIMVGDIRRELAAMQASIDANEKDRIRWEVLDFANSCRNGIRHTKDEFQHIIALNTKYKKLLHKTNDENGVFDAEYEYILELYAERQRKNDFL